MKNNFDAFVDKDLVCEPFKSGKLDGITYAVKDVYSIKGYTNTAGNPDWFRTHTPAEKNAEVIDMLQENGAKLIGTTHTDELMYSLNGENYHYGTPVNPKAPDSIPGGSSSGSAVVAAGGLVDFSLGTDTGGSVRIPASYCGVYGIRPTHGAVSSEGIIPLAPSFDTVGWMTENVDVLRKVGDVLLAGLDRSEAADFRKAYLAEDAWNLLDEDIKQTLSSYLPVIEKAVSKLEKVTISEEGLDVWADTFRILQGIEIGETHGEWIKKENPQFGPGIAERFAWTTTLSKDDYPQQYSLRKNIQESMALLLKEYSLLVLPTAPKPAPKRGMTAEELEDRRKKTMQLSCIAGLSGFPQISLPVGNVEGKPIGLSILANRNQDKKLLDLAVTIQQMLSLS